MNPIRMNTVPVKILIRRADGRMDSSNIPIVVIDEDFWEPIGSKIYGSAGGEDVPVTTEAQVVWGLLDIRNRTETGDAAESRGRLTFRKTTYDSLDATIKKGDIIVDIAGVQVDLKVTEVRPSGHLFGGPLLMMVFFEQNRERIES